jgi:hypothetical protein
LSFPCGAEDLSKFCENSKGMALCPPSVPKLLALWEHIDQMITFLLDMIDDFRPLRLWNEECVDCYLLVPSTPH